MERCYLAALRAEADRAAWAYNNYIESYGTRWFPRPGFNLDRYMDLMRASESASGAYAETLYGTQ
jgi:hypothetical protein